MSIKVIQKVMRLILRPVFTQPPSLPLFRHIISHIAPGLRIAQAPLAAHTDLLAKAVSAVKEFFDVHVQGPEHAAGELKGRGPDVPGITLEFLVLLEADRGPRRDLLLGHVLRNTLLAEDRSGLGFV